MFDLLFEFEFSNRKTTAFEFHYHAQLNVTRLYIGEMDDPIGDCSGEFAGSSKNPRTGGPSVGEENSRIMDATIRKSDASKQSWILVGSKQITNPSVSACQSSFSRRFRGEFRWEARKGA